MLPERVQVPVPDLVTKVLLPEPELLTIAPATSPEPGPVRVRVFEPLPVAVKLLVNLRKPVEEVALIVALPVVPAKLMVRLVVCVPLPV